MTIDDHRFDQMLQLMRNPLTTKTYHNAPFDLRVLRNYTDPDPDNIDDTQYMARLLPEQSATLEDLSGKVRWRKELDRETQSMKDVLAEHGLKGNNVDKLPTDVLARKCQFDAMATHLLYYYYAAKLDMTYYLSLIHI